MKNLKVYKILDWILLGLSYIPAFVIFYGASQYDKDLGVCRNFTYGGLIGYGVLLALILPMFIYSIVTAVVAKDSLAKHTMAIKLAYVPFFVINFIDALMVVLVFKESSAWLVLLVIILSIFVTYLLMLRTSLPDIVCFIKAFITKRVKVNPIGVLAIIGLFFFCFDVVAAIILVANENRYIPSAAMERKIEKTKKYIDKWNRKKHMSLKSYKTCYFISTFFMYFTSIVTLGFVIYTFISIFLPYDEEFSQIMSSIQWSVFILSPIFTGIALIFKVIAGKIYSKNGDEDPTQFVVTSKYYSIPVVISFIASYVMLLMISTASSWLSVLLIPFAAVIIVAMAIIGCFFASGFTYFLSLFQLLFTQMLIWSDSLVVYNYWMHQRKVQNRKFAGKIVVLCMVLLWFPVLNIPALYILRTKSKNNNILGEKPVLNLD